MDVTAVGMNAKEVAITLLEMQECLSFSCNLPSWDKKPKYHSPQESTTKKVLGFADWGMRNLDPGTDSAGNESVRYQERCSLSAWIQLTKNNPRKYGAADNSQRVLKSEKGSQENGQVRIRSEPLKFFCRSFGPWIPTRTAKHSE
jgi:hypothetical protein